MNVGVKYRLIELKINDLQETQYKFKVACNEGEYTISDYYLVGTGVNNPNYTVGFSSTATENAIKESYVYDKHSLTNTFKFSDVKVNYIDRYINKKISFDKPEYLNVDLIIETVNVNKKGQEAVFVIVLQIDS
jgi:hypothetical protein